MFRLTSRFRCVVQRFPLNSRKFVSVSAVLYGFLPKCMQTVELFAHPLLLHCFLCSCNSWFTVLIVCNLHLFSAVFCVDYILAPSSDIYRTTPYMYCV